MGLKLSQAWRTKQLEYTWQRSLMRCYAPFSQVTADALLYSCALLNLPLGKPDRRALMEQYLRLALFPEVAEAMRRFQGVKRAILTNGSPDMIDPLVAHSGLALDAVLSVDALKIYKPAPEVYQFAVDRLGIPKEEIGFVSSNCWDAMGAKAFGFTVYWINRGGAPLDRLGFQPDKIVSGLHEILR
jgi:2-haloacid dehalogenase